MDTIWFIGSSHKSHPKHAYYSRFIVTAQLNLNMKPQHELELDLIMGTTQELLRHFQAT